MKVPLRVLILEDVASDAELALRELHKAGLQCDTVRVDELDEFLSSVRSFNPDVIIADYSLPTLNALDALKELKKRDIDIPFILCTGTQSEEVAVRCMKEGAIDYILKTSLKRLPTAVENAIAKKVAEEEKEEARAALRQSEEQHRLIAEHTRDLIGIYDPSLVVRFLSPSLNDLLGYDPTHLQGTSLLDLVHPDDRQAVQNTIHRSRDLREVKPLEFRIRQGEGLWRDFESAGRWIFDADGEPDSIVIISRDITDRKNLEAQLRQAQKMEGLGTLAGGIAHDFNNLLGIILGHTFLIEQSEAAKGAVHKNLEAITTTVERGSNLVHQLLAFARKSEIKLSPISVNGVIEELTHMLGETFPTNIDIRTTLTSEPEKIFADHNLVHQVLLNLCVNARDAMPDGGTLTIRTRNIRRVPSELKHHEENTRPYLCLSVEDTGIGMDDKTRARIFEPFFTTKGHGKGTGLGLSTVYGIMNTHGGTIEVESEPGKGTTFSLFFPLLVETHKSGGTTATKSSPTHGKGETILVVEDEVMLLDLSCSILQSHGYRVLRAQNGLDAVRTFQSYSSEIDLVLSDLGLPGIGGMEAFHQMRKINPNIVAILVTGYLDGTSREEVMQDGIAGILQKPYMPGEILAVVHKALTKANAHSLNR